jgi:hypothetical protein
VFAEDVVVNSVLKKMQVIKNHAGGSLNINAITIAMPDVNLKLTTLVDGLKIEHLLDVSTMLENIKHVLFQIAVEAVLASKKLDLMQFVLIFLSILCVMENQFAKFNLMVIVDGLNLTFLKIVLMNSLFDR